MSHRTFLTAAALVLGLAVGLVAAQDKPQTKTAVGAVAKIDGTSLSVDTGKGVTMQFVTSAATAVKVATGSSQAREARAEGKAGVKITDAVHAGDQVQVKYTDVGGKLMASEVEVLQRRPASANPVK
jgi:hypothetical protein